jgi:hypothetical protein
LRSIGGTEGHRALGGFTDYSIRRFDRLFLNVSNFRFLRLPGFEFMNIICCSLPAIWGNEL